MGEVHVLVTDTAPLTPVRWGGPHRIFTLFANLPEDFQVTYVGLDLNSRESREHNAAARLHEMVVPPSRLFPAARRAQLALLREESIDLYSYILAHHGRAYRNAVLREAECADILVASHPWGFPLLQLAEKRARKAGQRKLLVYDAHNCELTLAAQILKKTPGIPRSVALRAISAIEKEAVRESALVLACSARDADEFARHYGAPSMVQMLPNAVRLREAPSPAIRQRARNALGIPEDERSALFIGSYYRPNIEAFEALLDIAAGMPAVRFHVAGSVSGYPESHPRPRSIPSNVALHGVVDEEKLGLLLSAADIALNPTLTGGGIQIKMLDYLAAGLPVVTTPHGARGLPVEHGKHLLLADSSAMKGAVEQLLASPALGRRLGAAGRELVAKRYDAAMLSGRLAATLRDAWSAS